MRTAAEPPCLQVSLSKVFTSLALYVKNSWWRAVAVRCVDATSFEAGGGRAVWNWVWTFV